LLVGAIGVVGFGGIQPGRAIAAAPVACDTGLQDCNCPGCRAFLEGCETQVLPPVVMPDESVAPSLPSDEAAPEAMQLPTAPSEALAPSAFQPSPSALASSLGAAGGGAGLPSMIGDFFAGGYNYAFVNGASVATAGGDRRFKFAENNSPFPQDRVFFNYNHFDNALVNVNGNDANLDRFTFGLEKTVFSNNSSVEVRAPFALGLGTNPGGSDPLGQVTEFGNVALAVKHMLARGPNSAVAAGLGVVLPTGDDFSVGTTSISNVFQNDAVHVLPFLGVYHAPTSRLFSQFFAQLDFDVNGNDVLIGGQQGVLQDQTLLFLDYSVGYWLHRDRCRQYMRGVAPMVELHYSTTLQDQDYGPYQGRQIFIEDFRRDVLNLTGGLYFELGPMASLKIGGVSPLRTGSDKMFDSEIGVQFSRRF
jgi:hypothetical protein